MPIPKVATSSASLDVQLAVLREEFWAEIAKIHQRLDGLDGLDGLGCESLSVVEVQVEPELPKGENEPEANTAKATNAHNATNASNATNSPEPQISVFKSTERSSFGSEDAGPVSLVHFGQSAWSYPVVMGLVNAGPWDVVFAVLLMLLNLGAQAMFSYIIWGEEFMGEELVHQVEYARRWRTSFAHDHKYVDLSDRSLVTRVCSGDGSLIIATPQATIIEHINAYLGLGFDQFEPYTYQPGIALCILSILLWALCVYKEWRSIWLTFEGLWQIPRTSRTEIRDNRMCGLSAGRFRVLASNCLTRFVIASVLLYAGIRWLARTTSITELMLNAVALNAILDVDEMLFAGFTPLSVHLAVESLEPMKVKHSRLRSQIESAVLFTLLLCTFLVPYFTLLQPFTATMVEVKQELCAGFKEFVVGQNAETLILFGYETQVGLAGATSFQEIAVGNHTSKGAGQPGKYITMSNGIRFEESRTRTWAAEANDFQFCIETDVLIPGGSLYQDELLMTWVVNPRLQAAGAMTGRYNVSSCDHVSDLCGEGSSGIVRMICGKTCGCTDAKAAPWFKVSEKGCQGQCLARALDAQNPPPCEDHPVDGNWTALWDAYIPSLEFALGTDLQGSTTFFNDILRMVDAIKSIGCPAFAVHGLDREVTSNKLWCAGDDGRLFRPFAMLCPVSCGCQSPNPASHCPPCV